MFLYVEDGPYKGHKKKWAQDLGLRATGLPCFIGFESLDLLGHHKQTATKTQTTV